MPVPYERLDYFQYADQVRSLQDVAQVSEYGAVLENGRHYPLFRLDVPGERLLVITSGFHGEERSGPLTLATRFRELAAAARAAGVALTVFPCINPSGFEVGSRYNASGEKPNNDYLRYEVTPGQWKGELTTGEAFLRWKLFEGGPKETQALRVQLEALPTPVGMLDLHQDNYTPGPWVYAYTFGEKAPYLALLEASRRYAQIGGNLPVDELRDVGPDGLIEFNDGSITDYFLRRGTRYVATLETTTETPLADTQEVDLIWAHGFIQLVGKHR
ncbi:MAG: DUF2817 domain-containing protein [Myxococcota bacterium]|nr:DUF2817 domain-containing protein [Myxococcota bacterium]